MTDTVVVVGLCPIISAPSEEEEADARAGYLAQMPPHIPTWVRWIVTVGIAGRPG
jgi:hypothetical protein